MSSCLISRWIFGIKLNCINEFQLHVESTLFISKVQQLLKENLITNGCLLLDQINIDKLTHIAVTKA